MAAERLSDELKASGAAMLAELDKIGLNPSGALWLYFPHVKDWRFAVVSALVDTMGRRKVYGLIDEALERIGKSEFMTILDIHLYSASDIVPRNLGSAIRAKGGVMDFANSTVNGVTYDAVIYRLVPPPQLSEVNRAGKAFEKKVRSLA